MSKWNDRKKKEDDQNAQIEKPEESAAKDYSAGAIGKAARLPGRPRICFSWPPCGHKFIRHFSTFARNAFVRSCCG